MKLDRRMIEAFRRFDAANAEDPRTEILAGRERPRELAFAESVHAWVEQLARPPSEVLRLAARAHTLRRWEVPRDRYPRDTAGYHQWRRACAEHHAACAAGILRELGYDDEVVERVNALILKKNFPQDPDARILEDADCLTFLQLKLARYLDEWGDDKTLRILRSTLPKMSPRGREQAMKLKLGAREMDLLRRAAE